MRIRKRQLQQLPFSWISPLSSDPNFNRSPVVQHPPPPSDHPNPPIQSTQALDSSAFPETRQELKKKKKKKEDYLVVLKQGEEERGENGEKINLTTTTRKKSVTGSQSLEGVSEKNPLKKRKMQKNKRGENGALMEGSRCSRVNGRGWRCCQQTLAGYSLCEHHLGKGRLRSTTITSNVRNNNNNNNNNNNAAKKAKKTPLIEQFESENGEEKPLMKLGMVKARSISSLLGQNDNIKIAVSDDN